MRLLALFVTAVLATTATAANWAVIVAGSNNWSNYRHQADACHAFHIAKRSGIPTSNIITMIYDDIANNARNPYPGQIFNKPTDVGDAGYNVYEGCQMDYTGNNVTAKNFLSILTGDSAAVGGGKVLKSGPNDNVFIFYSDHGSVGILAFPVGGYLSARDLNAALKTMHSKGMYNKLVFYLEACNSGSMFDGVLPEGINAYVTTAAHPRESSWGHYCPPMDKVNGKSIGTCLGDEYSIAWMESVDQGIASGSLNLAQTWAENYVYVRDATKKSDVMQYGEKHFLDDQMGSILGAFLLKANATAAARKAAKPAVVDNDELGRVSSRDIPLNDKYYEYLRADRTNIADYHTKARALIDEIEARIKADTMFLGLSKTVAGSSYEKLFTGRSEPVGVCGDCCDAGHQAVFDYCGGYSDYSMEYARIINDICVTQPSAKDFIVRHVRAMCL